MRRAIAAVTVWALVSGCAEELTSRFEFACTNSGGCGAGFTCDPVAHRCRPTSSAGDVGDATDGDASASEVGTEDGDTTDDAIETGPGPGACPNGVVTANYLIASPAAAAALEGCTDIGGDLMVRAPGMTALALPTLRTVGGSLEISGNQELATVSLGALTSVGGRLQIWSNAALTRVERLATLTSVGSLHVGHNPLLTSLDLAALAAVQHDLEIANSDALISVGVGALTSVGGEVHIDSNAALTNVGGFSGLTSVTGGLFIQSNAALRNLDGFTALVTAQRLHIYANTVLTSILGLRSFELLGAGPFTVVENPALPTCQAEELLGRLLSSGYAGAEGDSITGNDDTGTCP